MNQNKHWWEQYSVIPLNLCQRNNAYHNWHHQHPLLRRKIKNKHIQKTIRKLTRFFWRKHSTHAAFISTSQTRLTENGSDDLEANKLVVLKQLDERKCEHRQIIRLTKYWWPVSQRRQNSVHIHTTITHSLIYYLYLLSIFMAAAAQHKHYQPTNQWMNIINYNQPINQQTCTITIPPHAVIKQTVTAVRHAGACDFWWDISHVAVHMLDVCPSPPVQRRRHGSPAVAELSAIWTV